MLEVPRVPGIVMLGLTAAGLMLLGLAWLWRRRPWRGAVTRYPVVLAYGLFGFDEIGVGKRRQKYFRGIPERLEALGVKAYRLRVPTTGSVESRAQALADAVRELPEKRVNIIAHSMGGLDARYAICFLGISPKVASLTTLSTPHRGTPLADVSTDLLGEKLGLRRLLGVVGVKGRAFYDLTTAHMQAFNKQVTNVRKVRYFSVIATVHRDASRIHPLLVPTHAYLSQRAGPNDGVVPTSSQRWGTVLACLEADHWAQIGWGSAFDAPALFERLLRQLRSRGL